MVTIGIDLGGTRMRVGLVSRSTVLWKQAVLTQAEQGPHFVIGNMFTLITQALRQAAQQGLSVQGIGIGCPGPLDPHRGTVLSPPNLPGWDAIPLTERVAEQFALPVFLDNDANVAALGEWLYGAGQGYRNLVYVTISTGIGGGVIAEGKLLRGKNGGAAEFGHMCVQAVGGADCACRKRGCLEAYSSGTGIVRRTLEQLQRSEEQSLLRQASQLTPASIAAAAAAGDALSARILSEASHYLGVGLANILNLFNPEVLILGGGLTALQDQVFTPALSVMRNHAFGQLAADLPVTMPALGDDAGLIGAAALLDYSKE